MQMLRSGTEGMNIKFDSTIDRLGRSGDNWCMTWADDGHQYTACDDGWGWDYANPLAWRGDHPMAGIYYNNRVWRLTGGPHDMNPEYLPNYPLYYTRDEWYGFGILSVDGTLYHFITCASGNAFNPPFQGAKLVYSTDHGNSWRLHDGQDIYGRERDKTDGAMFFWHEGDGYAFSNIEFLQCGRDNSLAKDGYVYLYAPNGRYRYHQLNCARVPKERILDRSAYEFFLQADGAGGAVWTRDIHRRGAIHQFPGHYGWYSWLPSVVYNQGLDLFIMAAGGTGVNGSGMHELPASLGIYCAGRPWGPWEQIYYTDEWVADNPANRLYQPKLSPKWISADGREMFLVFSDASDNWGRQYRWNQQRIVLTR